MTTHHPIHLCQPDNKKSCGACCGLYNWKDHSRPALESILKQRTELFFSLGESQDLDEYKRRCQGRKSNGKLFETVFNCEFLGFVDSDHKKVGCLLHPVVNKGNDLRDLGFYGAKTCSEHFCPSYSCLKTTEQKAIIESIYDWYLYGLLITDIDLVREFFRHIENTMGDSIKEVKLKKPGIVNALTDFFMLKQDWKFKTSENMLGKYYFSEAEYNIVRIEYKKMWGIQPSRFDRILVSLESDINSKDDLFEAETIIEGKIKRFIEAYEAG